MRRFYAHPETSHQVEHTALVAVLAAATALVIPLWLGDGDAHWVSLLVPGAIVAFAAYAFVRARIVERLPVAEITDTHFRWRLPGNAMFHSVRLADIVAVHGTDEALRLLTAAGITHVLPLKDMQFHEGSFAVDSIRSELARLSPRGTGQPHERPV